MKYKIIKAWPSPEGLWEVKETLSNSFFISWFKCWFSGSPLCSVKKTSNGKVVMQTPRILWDKLLDKFFGEIA